MNAERQKFRTRLRDSLRAPLWAALALVAVVAVAVFFGRHFDVEAASWIQFIEDEIQSWGALSGVAAIGLMIAHSFVPFPAEFLTIANGMLFGAFWGIVVTWIGAMLGAYAAFGLARLLGRPFVEKMVHRNAWHHLDQWTDDKGWQVLLVSRFIPVIAFNLINYAAGLTNVSWFTFSWTTAIGILPATILMVLLGDNIELMTWQAWLILALVGLILWLVLRLILNGKYHARAPYIWTAMPYTSRNRPAFDESPTMNNPSAPRVMPPEGAIDTHIHIVGDYDAYPLAPTALIKPGVATLADFRTVIGGGLGVRKAVVVQPSIYGFDNTCTLDAVAALGDDGWGVVVVPGDISEADLEALHARRVRGLRFHMLPGGVHDWSELEALCAKVAPLGWYAQVQFDGRDFTDHEAILNRLTLPVIIDHQGKFLEPVPADHGAVRAMARFLDRDNAWLKIAAACETSKVGPPIYADVRATARVLLAAAPERTIWASNC